MNKSFEVIIGSQYEEVEEMVHIVKSASSKYEAIFLATKEVSSKYFEKNNIDIEDDSVIIITRPL